MLCNNIAVYFSSMMTSKEATERNENRINTDQAMKGQNESEFPYL